MKKLSLVLIFLFLSYLNLNSVGNLIVLNGTSNAGKTTIATELKKFFGNSYQIFCIDDFIWRAMERKVNDSKEDKKIETIAEHLEKTDKDWSFSPQEWGEFIKKVEIEMYKEINLVLKTEDVICDTVLQTDDDFKRVNSYLEKHKPFFVLIYCSLLTLPDRARKRGNLKDVSQKRRPLFWALSQFGNIYKEQKNKEDIVIDKLTLSCFQKGVDESLEYDSNLNLSWYKFDKAKFDILVSNLKQKLVFSAKKEIFLTPQFNYDFIVDNSKISAVNCAKKLAFNIKSSQKS